MSVRLVLIGAQVNNGRRLSARSAVPHIGGMERDPYVCGIRNAITATAGWGMNGWLVRILAEALDRKDRLPERRAVTGRR